MDAFSDERMFRKIDKKNNLIFSTILLYYMYYTILYCSVWIIYWGGFNM